MPLVFSHLKDQELFDPDTISFLRQVRGGMTTQERRWLRSLADGTLPGAELLLLFLVCQLGEQALTVTPTVPVVPSPRCEESEAVFARAGFREGRRLLLDGEFTRRVNTKAAGLTNIYAEIILLFLLERRTS